MLICPRHSEERKSVATGLLDIGVNRLATVIINKSRHADVTATQVYLRRSIFRMHDPQRLLNGYPGISTRKEAWVKKHHSEDDIRERVSVVRVQLFLENARSGFTIAV